MSDFAQNLKALRAQKGISQDNLAQQIGVHVTHLSRYERGLSSPSLEVAQKIAEALDTPIDFLVKGDNKEQVQQSLKDMEMLNLFKQVQGLDEKQKDTVKDLLSAFILKADLQQKLAS
jgi:transcriptional regulator with XRE-family HTH domain